MSIKKIQPFFPSTERLLLCLLLGVLTAWLLREEVTSLLLGRDFTGRSLPVQAGLLLGLALAAALFWAVILYFYGEALASFLKGIPGWLRAHPEITLILFLSFIARFFLANWNSYWYDELVSVKLLGIDRSDVLDVVRSMVTGDRHPPLYQVVLFYWMQLFGSSELATRMLSTLYVTLSVLTLYLLANGLYGKRVAIAAALFFNFSNIAVYYSLESRNFAQALFLSTLSAYVLHRYLRSIGGDFSWKAMFLNRWFFIAVVVNLALLLTMYYNAFALLAQAVFLFIYLVYHGNWRSVIYSAGKTAAYFLPPVMVFLALWGGAILLLFNDMDGGLGAAASPAASLPVLFAGYVVSPNFSQPGAVWAVLLLILLAMPGLRIPDQAPGAKEEQRQGDLFRIYLLCWAVLPLVFIYLSFFMVQPPYLYARYFVFCTPPLMVLVVLGLEQVVMWMDRFTRRTFNKSAWEHYTRNALLYALLATVVLVLPRGYDAAISRKHDWRAAARQLVALASSDPQKDYLVIETCHRDTPRLNFYLERYSPSLRAADVLPVSDENGMAAGEISRPGFMQRQDLAGSDYLVVEFIHFRQEAFPQSLALLKETYPIKLQILDNEGRGFVIYDLQSAGE